MISNRWRLCNGATVAVLSLIYLNGPASACRGPQFEHYILLDATPLAAESAPVIAKVEILGVEKTGQWTSVARGRVLEAVKGVEAGQIISIAAVQTSCGGGMDQRAAGRRGFIAGAIGESGLFRGTWSDWKLRISRQ